MPTDKPPAAPPLLGSYAAPPLKRGDRLFCRYRRAWCKVTSWTDAPLSWPKGVQIGIRSGPGLIVTRGLERAVRTESAVALKHWFDVSTWVAWAWRKRFTPGEGHVRTKGDRLTHRRIRAAGADATRGVPLSEAACDARAERAKRLGLKPTGRWAADGWTDEQRGLLCTMPDDELAAKIGRTPDAVRCARTNAKIPSFRDRRRRR